MKLAASAPGKVVLFGEWAVLEGGPGIAIAVPPRLHIAWNVPDEARDDAAMIIRGDGQTGAWDPQLPCEKQPLIPPFLRKTVKLLESLMFLDNRSERALRRGGVLQIEREWDIDQGLGSSSAIVAALMEIIGPERERVEKWQLGRETIRRAQGGAASGLDLAAQLRGNSVSVVQDRPRPLSLEMPSELLFLHGGEKADTSTYLQEQRVPSEARAQLGKSAAKFIETSDWLTAIREHSEILAACDVWPEKLREARQAWTKAGLVLGMKSCGAGGGDTWMLWTDPSKRAALDTEIARHGWKITAATMSADGSRRETL